MLQILQEHAHARKTLSKRIMHACAKMDFHMTKIIVFVIPMQLSLATCVNARKTTLFKIIHAFALMDLLLRIINVSATPMQASLALPAPAAKTLC